MTQQKVKESYGGFLKSFSEFQTLEREDASLNALLNELSVCFWMHDEDYSIVYANRVVEEKFGPCHGRKCYEYFMGEENICSCCLSKNILTTMLDEKCSHCKRGSKTFDIDIYHIPLVNQDGKKFIVKSNMHIQDINLLNNK